MSLEMLPHHAGLLFNQRSFEKGPKKLSSLLSSGENHRLTLERNLTEVMTCRLDEQIIFRAGQHDFLCEDCPGQNGPYELQGCGSASEKCDPSLKEVVKKEKESARLIKRSTGKENPTPREIYKASCKEAEKRKERTSSWAKRIYSGQGPRKTKTSAGKHILIANFTNNL